MKLLFVAMARGTGGDENGIVCSNYTKITRKTKSHQIMECMFRQKFIFRCTEVAELLTSLEEYTHLKDRALKPLEPVWHHVLM